MVKIDFELEVKTDLEGLKLARSHHASTILDNKLFVIGGEKREKVKKKIKDGSKEQEKDELLEETTNSVEVMVNGKWREYPPLRE